MTLEFIGAVIESVYSNGRPKIDKKMDRRDFIQLARMANGSIMRKIYYEERQLGQQFWYFGAQVETKKFKLSDPVNNSRIAVIVSDSEDSLTSILRLPNGMGILGVKPIPEQEGCDFIARAETGADWLYCGPAYEGVTYWMLKGKKLVIKNLDKCFTHVEVDGIFDDESMDIPEDIAFDIVLQVCGLVLKVFNFPIDKTNDNDPNVLNIRNKLAQPSSL